MKNISDIRSYGAQGNGVSLDTAAIQLAIDTCSASGGGTIVLDEGRFCVGTLFLKDNVIIEIRAGAVLLGSPDIANYATDTHKNMYKCEPHMNRCLIFARGAKNIGLIGTGTIVSPTTQVYGLSLMPFFKK